MSDLSTSFRITANYYGPNGFATSRATIKTAIGFSFDYILP